MGETRHDRHVPTRTWLILGSIAAGLLILAGLALVLIEAGLLSGRLSRLSTEQTPVALLGETLLIVGTIAAASLLLTSMLRSMTWHRD